jgi:hypothetical protein
MLKRYVLRSKVRLRDVSSEYDVWAAWGSEREKEWETERIWDSARSGAIEPVWKHDEGTSWHWGKEPGVLRDRRAIGMGHRLIVRKGDLRKYYSEFSTACGVTFEQPAKRPRTTLPQSKTTFSTEYYMACPREIRTLYLCNPFRWTQTWT